MFLEGFGLEGRRVLPFCEKTGMVCVPLCEGSLSEQATRTLHLFPVPEPGVECADVFFKDRVGRDCTELQSVQTLVAAEGGVEAQRRKERSTSCLSTALKRLRRVWVWVSRLAQVALKPTDVIGAASRHH